MRRGGSGTGLAPNCNLTAPIIPSRRSSAVELNNVQLSGASLGTSLSQGSRSAATSPVGGRSEAIANNLANNKSADIGNGNSAGGSPNRSNRTSNEAWVCPNDRQLALRAKLQSGWSVKTAIMNQWKQPEPISAEEHEKIRQVVEKAAAMEKAEEERLGRLVERLEGLRQSRLGNGETDCILCGEVFRFYHHSQKRCAECAKMTCGKCGKEYAFQGATGPGQPNRPTSSLASSASMSGSMTSLISSALFGGPNSSAGNQDQDLIWLCKICAEQREMWKKSGAWFFKAMPKYAKPIKGSGASGARMRRFSHFTPVAVASTSNENLAKGGSNSGKEENSSEDELLLGRMPRGSISSAGPAFGASSTLTTVGLTSRSMASRLLRGESEATDDDDAVSIPSANGQSLYEVDIDNGRLSRPRALPSSVAPSGRSTSVPPPMEAALNRTSSPASSLGSPVACPLPPPRPRPGPPPRSLSPRYFRPPPGGPPPHLRGPPPWGRGFRPPPPGFDPRFSPRGMPRRPPMRPPPRHRLPGPPRGPPGGMRGPPRGPQPYGHPPPRFAAFPHSAPHSPMAGHRLITEPGQHHPRLSVFVPVSTDSPSPPGGQSASLPPLNFESGTSTPSAATDGATALVNQEWPKGESSEGTPVQSEYYSELKERLRETPTSSDPGKEVEDEEEDEEEEVPSPPASRTFTKAKPLPERENKFTSTLRRLSTVRKRNRTKRKTKEKELASNGDSGIEAPVTTPSSSHDLRPSSTTSRESEAEALTSGYFSRQESQSRGSDETLSPPRSPEGSYGLIEFSVSYDEGNQDLHVNVIKAKKLKGMDANGLCDSFCQVSLVSTSSLNLLNAQSYRKTKTVSKNINPHYNANLHFPVVSYDVFTRSSIHLAILDEDMAGDYLLAEAKFPLNKLLPQMQKKFQVALEKPDLRNSIDGLLLSSSHAGRIELSLGFYAKSGTLKVLIIQCQGLLTAAEGSANPFVKAVLHPLNKNSKHETTVKWKTADPEFHEQFVYLTSSAELPKQTLHITVWDRGKNSPDKYIGGIVLGMNAKGSRLQHWSDMIKSPGQAQAKIHYLSANYID